MDENKKLNILKDRKLDRQEKNKSEGLKKGKGATLCSDDVSPSGSVPEGYFSE